MKDVELNLLDRIIMIVARVVVALIVARILGPAGYGSFQVALTASVVIGLVAEFGFGIANNYYASYWPHRRSFLLINTYLFVGGMGILFGLLTAALLRLFQGSAPLSELPRSYFVLLPLSIPIQALMVAVGGVVYGMEKFAEKVKGSLLQYGLFIVLVILSSGLGMLSAGNLFLFWMIGNIATVFYWAWRLRQEDMGPFHWDTEVFKAQFFYGGRSYFYNLANILNFRLDIFLVAYLGNSEQVGWYSLASTMAEALLYIPKALSNVILTSAAARLREGITSTMELMYKAVFIIMGLIVLLLAVISPYLIPVIFTTRFVPAVVPFLILLPGIFFMALGLVSASHLFGLGKPKPASLGSAVAVVATAILDVVLIPIWQVQGAAVASTISYGLFFLVNILYLSRAVGRPVLVFFTIQKRDLMGLGKIFIQGFRNAQTFVSSK